MASGSPIRGQLRHTDFGTLALDVLIFVSATAGTYLAQVWDRPRSAVLVFVVGVMIVGGRSGLKRGIAAGLLASLIYNFFLSEPAFHFSWPSADELVPLLAFNISAVLSGAMAGRLKDSAKLARSAEARNAHLLRLSDELQRAITEADVLRISRMGLPSDGITDLDIFLLREDALYPAGDVARRGSPVFVGEEVSTKVCPIYGSAGQIGLVRFMLGDAEGGAARPPDLQGIANILGLAIDRCLLLEQLSEKEVQQKSEQLKAAILSSVSHDLRTPLTAIEAAATSLRDYDVRLSAKNRADMLTTISEQCRKLNRYTANLLDMGRIQAGISSSLFIDVDVLEILGVVLASMRQAYPEQEIRKQITLDSGIVKANPVMLEQVIFNLLENAILHGAGDQPVFVTLTRAGKGCVLEVVDFGRGISPDEQALVFEKFYRSNATSHREGNGLGLHIAHGFTEAFGGRISIVSPHFKGRGTKMVVELPLSDAPFEHRGNSA